MASIFTSLLCVFRFERSHIGTKDKTAILQWKKLLWSSALTLIYIGGSTLTDARRTPPPPRVQILSFWHTTFSKCNRLGSPCPPLRGPCPPTGNPGSATDIIYKLAMNCSNSVTMGLAWTSHRSLIKSKTKIEVYINKNAFQSKAHLPLADRKSKTYNLTFKWPWPGMTLTSFMTLVIYSCFDHSTLQNVQRMFNHSPTTQR